MSIPLPEQCNFIAIGDWNPAIIRPQWLKREFPALIPEKLNAQVIAGVPPMFKIEFPDEFIIGVNVGRLVFVPKKLKDDTLGKIAELGKGIQEMLKHTPIAAAGCNFSFQLESDEKFKIEQIGISDEIKALYENIEGTNLVSRSVNHELAAEDHTITIAYDFKGLTKQLNINFNYQQPFDAMKIAANAFVRNFYRACDMCDFFVKSNKDEPMTKRAQKLNDFAENLRRMYR